MKKNKRYQPGMEFWVLKLLVNHRHPETILADYTESYQSINTENGLLKARLWLWLQILLAVPPFINNSIYWSSIMFSNYFKIACRNLFKYKTFSIINIAGLSLGITVCMVILLFIQNELSYDSYHEKGDNIYRVVEDIQSHSGTNRIFAPIAAPAGPALQKDYPDIVNAVRIWPRGNREIRNGDRFFYENNFAFVDPNIFEVFTLPFIKGDPATALLNYNTIVISESMANKYFGDDDPMGKNLTNNGTDYQVTGVIQDMPKNSHFFLEFLAPMSMLDGNRYMSNWHATMFYTYIEVADGISESELNLKIRDLAHNYEDERIRSFGYTYVHHLQPLKDIYLKSNVRFEMGATGQMSYIYMFAAVGLVTLLIACINFMSLSTARSINRAKEVGMRKVIGASRKQLILQFIGESLLISFVSLILSLIMIKLALTIYTDITGNEFVNGLTNNVYFYSGLLLITLFSSLLSGFYPAFFLSAFEPVAVIKGLFKSRGKGISLRRGMVVLQFAISIVLVVGTFTMSEQLEYMKNKELGFAKDQMLVLRFRGRHDLSSRFETLKAGFMENSAIISASASGQVPGRGVSNFSTQLEDFDENKLQSMFYSFVDHSFTSTYNMKILAGREFSSQFSMDTVNTFLINYAGAKALGFNSPEEIIGTRLRSGWGGRTGAIVGVVEDFNYRSLEQNIEPLVMFINQPSFGFLSLKINTNDIDETLEFVKNKWKEFYPNRPLIYFFLDDDFNRQYKTDEVMGSLFSIFTGLAIFIACMGLFGLTSFTAEQRTKEMGIRKTLGASQSNIIVLMSKDFTKWVIVSNIIAWPIGYYLIGKWLDSYAFRIELGMGVFLFSAILTYLIAILTVSWQSIRSSRANPVDSLRYE